MTTPSAQTTTPVNWTKLIAAGRATLIPKPPDIQPAPAAIRRAISTAYYAAFHALTANNAEVLIGARTFADLFCELQDERHTAEYNPLATFTVKTATTWLTKAETAIADFLQTSRTECAAIAILTLVRTR